jgi:uroporphyrinogen decarboxylase
MSATSPPPPFLAACRRGRVPYTPIWIMRQAGRYLPEYRRLRERYDFLTLTKTPELIAEVTLQPIRRFPLDAAILFSDIMTPLESMGLRIEFAPGPVVANPVRSVEDAEALAVPDPEEGTPFVLEAIRMLRGELPANVPLIGFAGAPYTLACYAIEGGGSKSFTGARAFLHAKPGAATRLLHKLADTMVAYLTAQVRSGAQALMLFDSWAGTLPPWDYRMFALPAVAHIVDRLSALDTPLIYFPNQGATLLPDVATLDVDVVGIDWRIPLSSARAVLGPHRAVQGNLDPAALFAPPAELERSADRVLAEAGPGGGHVFNLGHGIEPTTDPDAVARLVDHVHAVTSRD